MRLRTTHSRTHQRAAASLRLAQDGQAQKLHMEPVEASRLVQDICLHRARPDSPGEMVRRPGLDDAVTSAARRRTSSMSIILLTLYLPREEH